MTATDQKSDESWEPIKRAAEISGVPERTIYSRAKSGAVSSRKVEGVLIVRMQDLQLRATSQQTTLKSLQTMPVAVPLSEPAPDPVENEIRGEVRRIRLQRERRNAEREALAESERDAEERAQLIAHRTTKELEGERARLQLDQEKWRFEQEREAEQERQKQERAELERKRTAKRAEADARDARQAWARDWLDDASNWATARFGGRSVSRATAAVHEALDRVGPDDPPVYVARLVIAALESEFAAELDYLERRDAEAERQVVVKRALVWCFDFSDEQKAETEAALHQALSKVTHHDAEHVVTKVVISHRDRYRSEKAAQDHRHAVDSRWRQLEGNLREEVRQKLPRDARPEEILEITQELESCYREKRANCLPEDFIQLRDEKLKLHAAIVSARLQKESWERVPGNFQQYTRSLPGHAAVEDHARLNAELSRAHSRMRPGQEREFEREARRLVDQIRNEVWRHPQR